MASVTICSDFGAQENNVCHYFHCFPIYLPWSDGSRPAMILIFWMLSFKPAFSLSSFTFIKRLFSPSLRFVLGFFCGSAGKESTCSVGDLGSIPWLRRSPGEGNGYPLQYSGMENSMDCIVRGVSQRVRHNWVTFTFTGLSAIRVVSSAPIK